MRNLERLKEPLRAQMSRGACVILVARISDLSQVPPNLTKSELARFSKVRVAQQQQCHILGRTLVRYFLDLPTVDFDTNEYGKPVCENAQFNISHTRDIIAIAFHTDRTLGIDVEWEDRRVVSKDLAARVCHPTERAWINAQPATAQEAAFLRCWVRKESVLKATGSGLVDDLTAINTQPETPFIPIRDPEFLRIWDIPMDFGAVHCSLAIDPSVKAVAVASPTKMAVSRYSLSLAPEDPLICHKIAI